MVVHGLEPIGERIRQLRKSRRESQRAFAKTVGSDQGSICRWELGVTTPRLDVLIRIARSCTTSLDWLMGADTFRHSVADIAEANFRYAIQEELQTTSTRDLSDTLDIDIEAIKRWADGSYTPTPYSLMAFCSWTGDSAESVLSKRKG